MKKMFYFLGVCVGVVCFLLMYDFLTGPIIREDSFQFFTQVFLIVLTAILSVTMFKYSAETDE